MAGVYDPDASNASMVRVPAIIFFVLTPIFVFIRFCSRIRMGSNLGWDDWTILAALACSIVVSALMISSCDYGFGRHMKTLPHDKLAVALRLFYVAQIFYKVAINLTKASILLLYLRIFPPPAFRIATYTLLGVVLAYMVGTCASSIWQCHPIPYAWDKTIAGGACISLEKNWYANAGFSIATDVLIMALPQPLIWRLNIPVTQKWALMAVFVLGVFVTATSVFRMTTISFSTTSADTTYDIASTLWTLIEDNVAIICACLPMCRLPLAYLFPSLFPPKPGSGRRSQHAPSTTTSQRRSKKAQGLDSKYWGASWAATPHALPETDADAPGDDDDNDDDEWSPYKSRGDKAAIRLSRVRAEGGVRSDGNGERDDASDDEVRILGPVSHQRDGADLERAQAAYASADVIQKTTAFHLKYFKE